LANSGDERRKRLHQFLSDIGVKALRQHLGQLLGIAQVSKVRQSMRATSEKFSGSNTKWIYERGPQLRREQI